jgi:hypothetical protein
LQERNNEFIVIVINKRRENIENLKFLD